MLAIGFESSCDETAVGIVNDKRQILADVRISHLKDALVYGGVVPELTARAHVQAIAPLTIEALRQAGLSLSAMNVIGATCGPGLIGGVLVGAMAAKGIALGSHKPFQAINHLEAHLLTARLTDEVPFPFLTLLVSGGHCMLLYAHDLRHYEVLGQTRDDAVGESFDKVGKMMGIPYPAGPTLEQWAREGNPNIYPFPRPMFHDATLDFSFSGLKTAVRYTIEANPNLTQQERCDIAASFQKAIGDILCQRVARALKMFPHIKRLVVCGGVASNLNLRDRLTCLALNQDVTFVAPPLKLCTDNGVMVAWASLEYAQRGIVSPLNWIPRPRWPLSDLVLDDVS